MAVRLRLALIALLGLIGGIAAYRGGLFGGGSLGEEPLARVPSGASALLWMDAPAIRGSALWSELARPEGPGGALQGLEEICGEELMGAVDEVVLFTLGDDEHALGRLGLVATGTPDHAALTQCARQWAAEEGLTSNAVDLGGVDAVTVGTSRLAFVGSDAVVAGDEAVVEAVADLRDAPERSTAADETLMRLWMAVARNRHLVAVVRVPPSWRRSVQRALAERGERDTPVTETDALALGVRLGPVLDFEVRAQMDDPERATDAAAALTQWTARALRYRAIAQSALGPLLEQAHVEPRGRDVRVTVALSPAQLHSIVDLIGEIANEAEPAANGEPERLVPADAGEP